MSGRSWSREDRYCSLLRGIYASGGDPYPAHLLRQAERAAPSAHASGQSTMLEPLTERERQVLGFLSSHLSCRQIAARLYISPNTAKSHAEIALQEIRCFFSRRGRRDRGVLRLTLGAYRLS